jgi:site-specific DNA-methyltransferase (adenine-specific)/site-specific DNA-methyltransferase (cytosine-N4-specific)
LSDIKWTNDKIRLGDLDLWEHNPRYSTEAQGERITDSHRMFGQVETIAIGPDGEVFNGHQRVGAWIKEYGPDYEVDVRRASRKLDDQERQALTAMLHAGAVGSWDWDSLANWDADILQGFGFDEDLLKTWQTDSFALGDLLGSENGGEPEPEQPPNVDKAEELQEKWQVKSGDIFQMAEHRLICGDCREPETWERLLDGKKVNGVFTSPPYAEQRKRQYGGVPTDEYVEWWGAVQENVRAALAEDGSFFVNIKPHCEDGQRVLYVMDLVLAMVRRWGWRLVDELCWYHPDALPGKFLYRLKNQFEPIFQFSISNIKFNPEHISFLTQRQPTAPLTVSKSGNWKTDNKVISGKALPGNVIKVSLGANSESIQAASFPVALPTFFIKAYSDPGDIWVDPFVGSGTTIIAAENEGRTGYGIEKLEKYCAVTLQRWVDLTGREPRLLD